MITTMGVSAQSLEHQSVDISALTKAMKSIVQPLIHTDDHVVRMEKIEIGIMGFKQRAQVFDAVTGAEVFNGEVEIPGADAGTAILLHVPRPDGVWVLYNSSGKKGSIVLNAAKLELPELAFVEHRALMDLPAVPGMLYSCWRPVPFSISASPDGQRIAVFFDRYKKKDKQQPAQVVVFDADLGLLWERNLLLDDPEKGMTFEMCVNNKGNVAVLRRAGVDHYASTVDFTPKHTLRLFSIGPDFNHSAVITPMQAGGTVRYTRLANDAPGAIHLAGTGSATSKKKDESGLLFVNTFTEDLTPVSAMSEPLKKVFTLLNTPYFAVSDGGEYCAAYGIDGRTVLLLSGPGGAQVKRDIQNAGPLAIRSNGAGFDLVLYTSGIGHMSNVMSGTVDHLGNYEEFGRTTLRSNNLYANSKLFQENMLMWTMQGKLSTFKGCNEKSTTLDWVRIKR